MTTIVLISVCIFFSVINFIATVLLSNAVFRLFALKEDSREYVENKRDSGLVDPAPTTTYDSRFRPQNFDRKA